MASEPATPELAGASCVDSAFLPAVAAAQGWFVVVDSVLGSGNDVDPLVSCSVWCDDRHGFGDAVELIPGLQGQLDEAAGGW